jgi:hypothetical protein
MSWRLLCPRYAAPLWHVENPSNDRYKLESASINELLCSFTAIKQYYIFNVKSFYFGPLRNQSIREIRIYPSNYLWLHFSDKADSLATDSEKL